MTHISAICFQKLHYPILFRTANEILAKCITSNPNWYFVYKCILFDRLIDTNVQYKCSYDFHIYYIFGSETQWVPTIALTLQFSRYQWRQRSVTMITVRLLTVVLRSLIEWHLDDVTSTPEWFTLAMIMEPKHHSCLQRHMAFSMLRQFSMTLQTEFFNREFSNKLLFSSYFPGSTEATEGRTWWKEIVDVICGAPTTSQDYGIG